MVTRRDYLTFCYICAFKCSRKVCVEDGKVVAIERDLESGLPTEWCPSAKGKAAIEIYSHPDRLKYPLKRKGARGEGKWERISWDEALDTIAKKLAEIKEKHGPEYVALVLGEPKGMEIHFAQRFATMFGTPNVATPGSVCGQALEMGGRYTFGVCPSFDGAAPPRLMVLWGCNTIDNNSSMDRDSFRAALLAGSKLAVIDPKKIDIAKRADLWIRLRPGSDGALAMGVIKVLIEENLYDNDFVNHWIVGFDHLREHVKTFTLADVENKTWVPQEQVKQLARLYAENQPACIQLGNAIDQLLASFQTSRAINIIRALSGNINTPGGDIFLTPAPAGKLGRFFFPTDIPYIRDLTKSIEKDAKLATRSAYIPSQTLVKTILSEKPHPIKAVLFMLANPLVSYANSEETYKAFMKLDFIAGSDIFPTPTTSIADIVLPAAWGAEVDTMSPQAGWRYNLLALPKLIDPPGEAWPDCKWVNELAKKLGLNGFWKDENEALDIMLKPTGVSWEEFKNIRVIDYKREYKKPEEGIFRTPSGKVEIYSERLKELGYSPMPLWEELSRSRFEVSEEYPLLMTNGKEPAYYLTGFKHVSCLREKTPQPVVELNPETAEKAGLKEGDWIYIETHKGKIKQQLKLNPDLDPRVVFAAFGWWFPEEPANNFQFRKSNINMLTDNDPPYDPQLGTTPFRGIPCRVSKS